MKRKVATLVDCARRDQSILEEVVKNPDAIAARFNLNAFEAEALRNDNFDNIGSSMGVDRDFRAANHDDAYLS